MKYLATFLLLASLLAGCSNSDTSTPATTATVPVPADSPRYYPKLVLDAEHNRLSEQQSTVALEADESHDNATLSPETWLRITDTNKLPVYHISAASGLWLDGSHYHFAYGTTDIVPNMVLMIMSNSVYKLYWPVETNIYIINSITTEPAKGERFHDFHSGDHADVAIGRWDEGIDKTNFWVSWAGQIDVK